MFLQLAGRTSHRTTPESKRPSLARSKDVVFARERPPASKLRSCVVHRTRLHLRRKPHYDNAEDGGPGTIQSAAVETVVHGSQPGVGRQHRHKHSKRSRRRDDTECFSIVHTPRHCIREDLSGDNPPIPTAPSSLPVLPSHRPAMPHPILPLWQCHLFSDVPLWTYRLRGLVFHASKMKAPKAPPKKKTRRSPTRCKQKTLDHFGTSVTLSRRRRGRNQLPSHSARRASPSRQRGASTEPYGGFLASRLLRPSVGVCGIHVQLLATGAARKPQGASREGESGINHCVSKDIDLRP